MLGRDAVSEFLLKLDDVIANTGMGKFTPDVSRSGMIASSQPHWHGIGAEVEQRVCAPAASPVDDGPDPARYCIVFHFTADVKTSSASPRRCPFLDSTVKATVGCVAADHCQPVSTTSKALRTQMSSKL